MTTSINLPIIGQGSQPAEEDGVELEYLPMPTEMMTYVMPDIANELNNQQFQAAKQLLYLALNQLALFPNSSESLSLSHLDETNKQFIDQLLGEGEVSILINDTIPTRIQESVLAGVWRIQSSEQDSIEIGIMPKIILELAFNQAAEHINTEWQSLPEGVMNAPPLLAELNAHIADYQPGKPAHSINLSLLPQTEQDLQFLQQRLGQGHVTLLSRGYGNCRITATNTRFVWWVQYYNSQDTLILNTLEVSDVPIVACASSEDIADSQQRLLEILKVYQ